MVFRLEPREGDLRCYRGGEVLARPASVSLCGPLRRLAREPGLPLSSQCLKTAPETASARRLHCSGSEPNEAGISAELGTCRVRWSFSWGNLGQWLWS